MKRKEYGYLKVKEDCNASNSNSVSRKKLVDSFSCSYKKDKTSGWSIWVLGCRE